MARKGELAYTVLVANVRLLPADSDLAETMQMGSEQFWRRYGVTVAAETAPILRGVVEQTLGMRPGVSREVDRWGGYLAVDETSDLVVGTCAFKGPPAADGTVEIAYYTFGPYEGQGYLSILELPGRRVLGNRASGIKRSRKLRIADYRQRPTVLKKPGLSYARRLVGSRQSTREEGTTTSTMMRPATTTNTALVARIPAVGPTTTPGTPESTLSTQTTMVAQ